VLLTGRPYAIGWALEGGAAPAAVLQSFFPGEEGGRAIADVLTGAVSPSGRLPVSLPRSAGAQPYSSLHPLLGGPSDVTSTDPTPLRPFGFGLSYTSFAYDAFEVDGETTTGGRFTASVTVTNTGDRAGAEVVQLYGRDPVASVTRPVAQLLGYARVELGPGESRTVRFDVPAARFAFSGRDLRRIVEPGEVQVWAASHAHAAEPAADLADATGGAISNERVRQRRVLPGAATARRTVLLTGATHEVGRDDGRIVTVTIA
jgi:beta-glucosidase